MDKETLQKLFNHMAGQHDLILLEGEMLDIDNIIKPYYMTLIERAFVAGRSKTSWEQFKKDNDL